ncbi:MAG: polysaccharide deacetylase family protein, partial [Clostridiales bacterium]|nr:polysaccharide deacetylase family protein [Clostridiales bacterium]
NHKNLTKLSAKDIKYEVERSNELINENADVGTSYIRPPYGAKSDDVMKNVNAPLIFWSVDSEDWKSKNKDAIYNMIMSNVKDGDIILMHDLYPTTADAMEKVIPELIRQGYKLVTVQELLEAKGITPEAGGVYYNAR